MEALIKNHNQMKMCRQCHRTKTLVNFINKTNTGICIICKTCRENQMKRYYDKKKKMKKAEERAAYLSANSVAKPVTAYNEASCYPTVQSSLSPITTAYPFPYLSQPEYAVPTQQWLPVPSTVAFSDAMAPVYPAKLVFYPNLAP